MASYWKCTVKLSSIQIFAQPKWQNWPEDGQWLTVISSSVHTYILCVQNYIWQTCTCIQSIIKLLHMHIHTIPTATDRRHSAYQMNWYYSNKTAINIPLKQSGLYLKSVTKNNWLCINDTYACMHPSIHLYKCIHTYIHTYKQMLVCTYIHKNYGGLVTITMTLIICIL